MRVFSQGWSDNKDGPGHRLIFYLKGCNFRCVYCGNPESINSECEVMFYPERKAVTALAKCCSHDLKCGSCSDFECVNKYHHKTCELSGYELSPEEILALAIESRHFIDGVTFGGGEATLQSSELLLTVEALHNADFHVALESNASTTSLKKFVGLVDYLICDLKAFTSETHERLTTKSNQLVLENLRFAAANQKELLIRVPLIPNYNTTVDELAKIKEFLLELRLMRSGLNVQILRLHHMGQVKYEALKREYLLKNIEVPTREFQLEFENELKQEDITIIS